MIYYYLNRYSSKPEIVVIGNALTFIFVETKMVTSRGEAYEKN